MVSLRRNKNSEKTMRRGASQWAVAWRRFKKHKSGLFGLGMVIVLLAIAALNSVIAPYPARPAPGAFQPLYEGEAASPPSWKHPFGTTVMGTDVYSEVIHGTVYTVYVAVAVTLVTMLIAISVGIVSGFMGRYVDEALMRITEIFLVFPSLLFILVFARLYQLRNPDPFWNILGINVPAGLTMIIIILSVFSWASYARVIRGEVLRMKETEYIQAAKGLGANSRWIMLRHIFPNTLSQVIVLGTLTMATAVLLEAAVSFLGFGDPNTITWGRLMEEGLQDLSTVWWVEMFPGLAVFLSVLAFNLVGDGLSDALNPRLRE
jgi:ABC-type dipeptide/oligopeptide/nickel transport system permease subunit